jgi:Pyridine nucleotide-disulphide oxidoreductase
MTRIVDVAIVGAGPYGLAIAAHLRAQGIPFKIFGNPMHSWRTQMPAGMMLKSEGFASNLYDPDGHFTLRRFCTESGLPYADIGRPVPLTTMTSYGLDFQKRVVPEVENKMVATLSLSGSVFHLRLSDDRLVTARRVVVATGTSGFNHIPPNLTHLPPELLSHSADHQDVSRFRNRAVTVIGGGASALDLAAALQDCGARVELVARRSALAFNPRAEADRPLWSRIRYPVSGIGFGLRSRFYTDAPVLFHFLPEKTRLRIVRTYLGPAGGYTLSDRIVGRAPLRLGYVPEHAEVCPEGIRLRLRGRNGDSSELTTSHVIAATGFVVDLRRISFLDSDIRARLHTVGNAPVLSAKFEASIPGLYFVGLASANSFGPVMRFMFGANYTARRLSQHLMRHAASRA